MCLTTRSAGHSDIEIINKLGLVPALIDDPSRQLIFRIILAAKYRSHGPPETGAANSTFNKLRREQGSGLAVS